MKVVLTEKEAIEAIREWCNKRFPVTEKTGISWKAHHMGGSSYRLEVTVSDVEMPPKDGPYR